MIAHYLVLFSMGYKNMKRTIMLLSFALMLCVMFASCGPDLPITSENFDKDFYKSFEEKYSVQDENLLYMTAGPLEVKMKNSICLALIDGVDKNMFVAGVQYKILMGPGHYDQMYIYQTEDAPIPMEDWTIKNICLINTATNPNWRYVSDEADAKRLMLTCLESNEILKLYTKYDESEARFVESMKETYSKRLLVSFPRFDGNYHLLFTFEECPNIVWVSTLWWANGYFFIEVNSKSDIDSYNQYRTFGLINEESGEMIRQALIAEVLTHLPFK